MVSMVDKTPKTVCPRMLTEARKAVVNHAVPDSPIKKVKSVLGRETLLQNALPYTVTVRKANREVLEDRRFSMRELIREVTPFINRDHISPEQRNIRQWMCRGLIRTVEAVPKNLEGRPERNRKYSIIDAIYISVLWLLSKHGYTPEPSIPIAEKIIEKPERVLAYAEGRTDEYVVDVRRIAMRVEMILIDDLHKKNAEIINGLVGG